MKLIKKYFIEAVIINKKKFLVSLLLILLLTIVSVFIPYGLRVFMEQISNNFSIKLFEIRKNLTAFGKDVNEKKLNQYSFYLKELETIEKEIKKE